MCECLGYERSEKGVCVRACVCDVEFKLLGQSC